MDPILNHQPYLANHTLLNESALTVNGECRLDYPYDQLPPLPNKAEENLPSEHMHKAYDAAWITEVVRQVALVTIFTGYGLYCLGIDVPLIGGEPGAARWGVLTGLCLRLGPIVPGLALVQTIARGHSFIGPSGLFTRGVVSATFSILVMEFAISLTRGHLEEDLKERKKFDAQYQKVYQEEASFLEKGLEGGITGANISKLKERAEAIQKKEEELKQIFGFNIDLFRFHLRGLYLRIQAFNPTKVDPSDRESMKQIMKRFVVQQSQSESPSDMIPYDFAQQKFLLESKVEEKKGKQPRDPTPEVQHQFLGEQIEERTRLTKVTESVKDKMKIGCDLDGLSVKLSVESEKAFGEKSKNGPLQGRKKGENNFALRASTAESHFKLVKSPSSELKNLHEQHQAKKKQYLEFEPSATSVKRAYVVATFLKKENWRKEVDWVEASKKRQNLERGLCDPSEFVQWVEERAFPEKQNPHADINLAAHNIWDHFQAITY